MLAGLITIIAIFAVLFAINSSIHSYLVVRYAEGNKVAQSVGFYYMSNAAGRLMGTLVSGALYSYVDTKNATIGIGVCVCVRGVGGWGLNGLGFVGRRSVAGFAARPYRSLLCRRTPALSPHIPCAREPSKRGCAPCVPSLGQKGAHAHTVARANLRTC
jgi:hypothetical protein